MTEHLDLDRLLADLIRSRRQLHLTRAVERGIISEDQAAALMRLHYELDNTELRADGD